MKLFSALALFGLLSVSACSHFHGHCCKDKQACCKDKEKCDKKDGASCDKKDAPACHKKEGKKDEQKKS